MEKEEDRQEQEYRERSGVLGGVASVLNAGGSAVVYAYDMTGGAIGKLFSAVKKAPVVPARAFDMVVGGLGFIKPGEHQKIEDRIKAYERKIKELYYEIGKEGAKYRDLEDPLQTEPVQKLIADVREYEKEIQRLHGRIAEIREERKEAAFTKKQKIAAAQVIAQKTRISDEQVMKSVADAIEKAAKQGVFESSSERAIFEKVAMDLLDREMEIKTLAAAELGKMGNRAAVPILLEAARFNNPDLTSEVINSLITIGATEGVALFKEKINDPKYRVRIGCIRGLFKLAGDDEALPLLTDALRDEHPEVRRSAATFLGWKDRTEAVPALVQCLSDKEAKVRKAAVSALANIRDDSAVSPLFRVLGDKELEIREKALEAIRLISGEDIAFDVHASGSELNKAVNALKDWWQEKRLADLDVSGPEAPEADVKAGIPGEAARAVGEPDQGAPETEAAEKTEEPVEAPVEVKAEERRSEPKRFAPEPEIPDPDAEAALLAAAEEEVIEGPARLATEAASTEIQPYTEQGLMKLLKSELLSICEKLGIPCDESLTKAQITERILEAANENVQGR